MNVMELLQTRFGGVLRSGSHNPNGKCCFLELLSQHRGLVWTDSPTAVRCWDLRTLNDAHWSSNAVRTEHMAPLLELYDGSLDWPTERQQKTAEIITLRLVREIIAELPGLTDDVRNQCRGVQAHEAAACAAAYAADAVADAAYAADAVADAAYAALAAARAAYAALAAARAADAARAAARAADAAARAADAAAHAAARAARAAAYAAARAAARAADADGPLIIACRIFAEAAIATRESK